MRRFRRILTSGTGAAVVIAVVVLLNVLLRKSDAQLDLTAGGQFTLSEGSRQILDELDHPVTLRYYVSEAGNQLPLGLRNHAYRVENLLGQFVRAGDDRLSVIKYDPEPDSEAEASAEADGLQGIELDMFREVYFGLTVTCLDRKVTLPLLDPERDALLEYDISQAISQVARSRRPEVALLSTHPVYGRQERPAARGGSGGARGLLPKAAFGFPPWIVLKELEKRFDVRRLDGGNPGGIADGSDDPDLLVVMSHRAVPEPWSRAIDAYLGRGGKALLMLDPFSVVPFMTDDATASTASSDRDKPDLGRLLDAWGLGFRPDGVVGDMTFRATVDYGSGPETYHTVLEVNAEGLNRDDPITASMDNLGLPFVGRFEATAEVPGLTKTPLVFSTAQAEVVPAEAVRPTDKRASISLMNRFEPAGERFDIALKLRGVFPPAYGDAADAADRREAAAVLIADTDLVFDPMMASVSTVQGREVVTPFNGNLELFMNSVDWLTGDERLFAIRSRGGVRRPFTRILNMQAEAEAAFRDRLTALERRLESLDEAMLSGAADATAEDGGAVHVATTRRGDDRRLRDERAAVRREMRVVRGELRRAVNGLKSRLQWINTAAMPAVVVLVGLGVAAWRGRRRRVAAA